MAYRTMRDAIVSTVGAVPGIGTVHPRLPYVAGWNDFLSRLSGVFGGQRQVRGWWLELESRRDGSHTMGTMDCTYTFVLRGIMAFNDTDDSDGEFGELVEAAMDELGSLTTTASWVAMPATLRVWDKRVFASTLCEYAEIEIMIHVEVAV